MEYSEIVKGYGLRVEPGELSSAVAAAREGASRNMTVAVWRECLACLDLTSLGAADTDRSVGELTRKAVELTSAYPGVEGVAAVCVYPSFVESVGLAAGDSDLRIASVCGGFPSSHTFLEVKMLEVAMAVESGADEVDVVMNPGMILGGEWDQAASEIATLRKEAGEETLVKVIIESGVLGEGALIRCASLLAMVAGADFVKSSTGKGPVAATPEAAVVICRAIRDHYEKTARRVGFKAAGGISTVDDAVLYYTIVQRELGPEWLSPSLFRLGASALADKLLGAIEGREVRYFR